MKIHESAENYLEAIFVLKQEKGVVRSVDIANYLEFSKPSVSRAVNLLRENGCVAIDRESGWVELTEAGSAIAERINERHQLMTRWLVSLGVPEETAAEDACRIEHDVSDETFGLLKKHILTCLEE